MLGRGKLSILNYHQVLEKPDPLRRLEVTAETFDWQMQVVSRYFTPLSLNQALDGLQHECLPANAICITFDDGYKNNLTVAQPILARYQVPATVYVATAFSQGQNMWNDRVLYLFSDPDRLTLQVGAEKLQLSDWQRRRALGYGLINKLKYLPVEQRLEQIAQLYRDNNIQEQAALMMTPEQIRELSDKGVTIGAHTVNHPILKICSEQEQADEIRQSRAQLADWIGRDIEHFAYPNGVPDKDFDQLTESLVRQAGFSSAVATEKGISDKRTSVWRLRRFTPWDKTPLKFHFRLIQNLVKAQQ